MATRQATKQANPMRSADDEFEAKFLKAINRRALRKPAPAIVQGNRSYPMNAYSEEELAQGTLGWFEGCEKQLAFYKEHGIDVMWFGDWIKRYWAAWSGGIDEALVRETIAEDCEYLDCLSFGRPMIGIQMFLDYNQAFYDACPDLRYDAIHGESAIQVSPEGDVTFMLHYTGCGHWDYPLRMYPFTEGSRALPATGAYVQMTAVDRYHVSGKTHKVVRGQTLWDPIEALQLIGLVPSDTSLAFKSLVEAGKVAAAATRAYRRLPFIGAE